MFTIGQAQKVTSRATSLAYSSVIFTRVSGPGGSARSHPGDGDNRCLRERQRTDGGEQSGDAGMQEHSCGTDHGTQLRDLRMACYFVATFSTSGNFHVFSNSGFSGP